MRRELAHAMRSVARTPVFSLTAIVILALGIGATTAMFALVNAVLLRPLPYPAADRLISMGSRMPGVPTFATRRLGLSQAQYFFLARRSQTLHDIGAYDANARPVSLTGDGPAERVAAAYATANLFEILGLRVERGRTILPDDDRPGARGTVAVLAHDLWIRRYGGRREIAGTSITVDGRRVPVIGVMQRSAQLPGRRVDVWFPLGADPAAPARNNHALSGVAHMRPGVSLESVRREMTSLTAELPQVFPEVYASPRMRESGFTTDVVSLQHDVVGSSGRVLWLLLAAVGLVLVIAGANVANLFLVRSLARKRESAIRTALGAAYVDLARQFMLESVLITGAAAVVGVAVAFASLQIFVTAAPWEIPRLDEVHFGASAVAFAVAVALGTGMLFGFLQLVGLSSGAASLRDEARGTTLSRRQRTVQRAFVVSQVAMALLLLAASGTLVRAVRDLQAVNPGFSSASLTTLQVALPESRARTAESASAVWKGLIERLGALPGVTHVAATQHAPLDGTFGCSAVFVEGQPLTSRSELPPCVYTVSVSPNYFATLQIPVTGGTLTWTDNDARSGGVVVSRALARRFWPNEDPIGKGLRPNGGEPPYYRVIGVAGDVRAEGLERPAVEAVYFPMIPMDGAPLWEPPREMTLLLRTSIADATNLLPAVRRAVSSAEPDAPITRIRTMDDILASATARVRFITSILVLAATMALLLSSVGLYSVIAYITSQRRSEIGIRLALGAQSAQILRSVVGQSVVLAMSGIALGSLGTLALAGVFRSVLAEMHPDVREVLGAASLLVLTAATLAGYIPARRAARVAPTEALRS
jgi:putative ABC transport system permease protein